jgi:hypothetical protein
MHWCINQVLVGLKNEVVRGVNELNLEASVFQSMINTEGMSVGDMRLVLENHNINQSKKMLKHTTEILSYINIMLGGNEQDIIWVLCLTTCKVSVG